MQIKDRLLLAAEQQFAAKGVHDTTLADVRRQAGASVGALYHHFPDKAELYRQVWRFARADYQRQVWAVLDEAADAEDGVRRIVSAHARWVTGNPARAAILAVPRPPGPADADDEENRRFLSRVNLWWRTHARYGAVRPLGVPLLYALWLGPIQEYSRLWLAGEIPDPPTEVADDLAAAAWRTLAGEPR
ncbi:TetR/AcrR family transcriptional regulator [Nocardia sp. NPDC004582]